MSIIVQYREHYADLPLRAWRGAGQERWKERLTIAGNNPRRPRVFCAIGGRLSQICNLAVWGMKYYSANFSHIRDHHWNKHDKHVWGMEESCTMSDSPRNIRGQIETNMWQSSGRTSRRMPRASLQWNPKRTPACPTILCQSCTMAWTTTHGMTSQPLKWRMRGTTSTRAILLAFVFIPLAKWRWWPRTMSNNWNACTSAPTTPIVENTWIHIGLPCCLPMTVSECLGQCLFFERLWHLQSQVRPDCNCKLWSYFDIMVVLISSLLLLKGS